MHGYKSIACKKTIAIYLSLNPLKRKLMKKAVKRTLAVFVIIIVLLLLPALLKEKGHPPLVGPDLAELKYTEIFFDNESADLKLSGMLFLPDGKGPFPTAVIIHGSGTSRRNSVWYLSVTKYLQNQGVAVLLPDKRGSVKSEGRWLGASFEALATDTVSAINYLKQQQMFTPSSIGLIGMSQGGWIAPIAATYSNEVSFVVSFSGAIVTPEEQLVHEEVYNIAPYTYHFLASLFAPVTAKMFMKKEFFVPWAGFDPIPYWKEVQSPVFVALGENDENVPVEASVNRIKENGLSGFMVKTYPDGGHAIRDSQTNEVSREFLSDLVRFIKAAEQG